MAVYYDKSGKKYVGSMAERKMAEDAKKNTTSTNKPTTSNGGSSGGSHNTTVGSAISRDGLGSTKQYTGGGSSGGNSQYTGSSNSINVNNNTQQAIKDKMNANSIEWWSADEAGKKQLEAANQELAAILGGSVSYDSASGTWSGTAEGNAERSMGITPSWNSSNPKGNYNKPYDVEMENLLDQILNREDFSYDVANDPLYQQYANMYRREGDRAMKETLAEAAAGAGGMNTYAMTAAMQANNYYNSQLNDKIPELYQLAYEMYLQDKESKVQNLGLLQSMDATQYNRYRDTISDYYNDRNFAYGVYRDDVADSQWKQTFDNNNYWANKEWDYNVGRDAIADKRYETEWDYNVGRDAIADSRYEDETSYNRSQYDKELAKEDVWRLIKLGVTPSADLIARAGMSEAEVNDAVAKVLSGGSVSGGYT